MKHIWRALVDRYPVHKNETSGDKREYTLCIYLQSILLSFAQMTVLLFSSVSKILSTSESRYPTPASAHL
jgi:hypothetical protein